MPKRTLLLLVTVILLTLVSATIVAVTRKVDPPIPNAPAPTPVPMETYQNAEFQFSLRHPSEWQVEEINDKSVPQIQTIATFKPKDANQLPILGAIYVYTNPKQTLETAIKEISQAQGYEFFEISANGHAISRNMYNPEQNSITFYALFEKDTRIFQINFVVFDAQRSRLAVKQVEDLITSLNW